MKLQIFQFECSQNAGWLLTVHFLFDITNFSGEKKTLVADGLFVAIGMEPHNEVFRDLVDLDEAGYVIAGENCKTRTPGVYAAGDCRTKTVRQLTTAAADGTVCGLVCKAV